MSKESLISIIVCVYNAEKYLQESLDSILRQEYKNFEVICVNDGSTDNSESLINEYQAKDSRVRLINKENGGVASAKNAGVNSAKGEYVFFVDADDYISEDYLDKAINKIIETGADAVMGEMYHFLDNGNTMPPEHIYDINKQITGKEALIKSINWEVHSSVLWKRSIYDGVSYDQSSLFADELTLRILYGKCKKVAFCKGRYYYRINPDSVTKKISPKIFEFAKEYIALKDLIIEFGIYDECKLIVDTRLMNTLNWLFHYRIIHKNCFSSKELKYSKNLLKILFDKIDWKIILSSKENSMSNMTYRALGWFYYNFKFSSFRTYILLSYILFQIKEKKNGK